jgi:carboxypeptidase Taq
VIVNTDYARFLLLAREIRDLGAAGALLAWDQEVLLPPKGLAARARHRAALAGVVHEKMCAPGYGELVDGLASAGGLDNHAGVGGQAGHAATAVREAKRDRDRAVKIPHALVTELAEAVSLSQQAWQAARARDDWPAFAPHLARLVALKRREAAAVGHEGEPYNALLDEFEPGARVETLAPLLSGLAAEIVPLIAAIGEARARAGDDPGALLRGDFDVVRQEQFSREVLVGMGFDLAAGRLDVSAHPFTSGTGPGDVRLTTRYDPCDLRVGLYATIHEGGHGLYEQGIPAEFEGTPLGDCASLGIHESQSRLWENFVGRSRAFWEHWTPRARELFPERLGRATPETLHRAVNEVRPSLIRIEADEVTYNLHIALRLELERALLAGEIETADLPALWNARLQATLGLTPATNREGVLQDIHWACGLFGYFPTYTLGNLYAAQLREAAAAALGDLDALIARGDTTPLLAWLRARVHARGRLLSADALCREVTGRELETAPFVRYLQGKFGALYGV